MVLDKMGTEPLVLGPEDARRVYHFRWPSVADRTGYRHAVMKAGGKRHSQLALLGALRRGGERLMADLPVEIREASLVRVDVLRNALIELATAARTAHDGPSLLPLLARVTAADADLADIESAVREGDARYAAMAADNQTYPQIAGQQACHHFLVGWEGFRVDLLRSKIVVSDASLSEIPEEDFPPIGAKIESMFSVPESQRKKSASLSPTPSDSGTSTS